MDTIWIERYWMDKRDFITEKQIARNSVQYNESPPSLLCNSNNNTFLNSMISANNA